MKFKLTVILATFVVTMGLLLGASAAQAATVQFGDSDDPNKASGITNLVVDGTPYNVVFEPVQNPVDVYGEYPGQYTFTTESAASEAVDAVVAALNGSDTTVTGVAAVGEPSPGLFNIGYEGDEVININSLRVIGGRQLLNQAGVWENQDGDVYVYNEDEKIFATFTEAGPPPESVTIGGSVTGLVGGGLVLQNNGGDDLPIDVDDDFEFATGVIVGEPYDVTVSTQPDGQFCSVENGNGEATDVNVTNVLVTCGAEPDPVSIGGTVTGLVGSGLVLQNNGGDNLTIAAADIVFEFAAPVKVGAPYEVTVFTQPGGQTCSVANGSGVATDVEVTNVEVTCADVVLSDVTKVAAVGDQLGDTVLTLIERNGGVAINIDGQVAFGGRGEDNVKAVFTQDGRVVAVGDTLPDADDTIVSSIHKSGEVAISDIVAFHGQAEDSPTDTDAVFTQDGPVAKEGESLGNDLVRQIYADGKVAINYFGVVAFHGETQIGVGLFPETPNAVFTSEEMLVKEDDTLEGTIVSNINETGGVAINLLGVVAFHGKIPGEIPGDDSDINAVFTSENLIAAEDRALTDTTIVGSIDANGGVAINLFGDVAFIGRVYDPELQVDTVRAVFTQDGPVAQEGDNLPDGTPLEEIDVTGGVAINLFGDVAFHGRTGGVKAVFTQHGLVARVGDNLDGGTTLNEIWANGGVAINPYGQQVAFHGQVGSAGAIVDAVFVGEAP